MIQLCCTICWNHAVLCKAMLYKIYINFQANMPVYIKVKLHTFIIENLLFSKFSPCLGCSSQMNQLLLERILSSSQFQVWGLKRD